MKSSFKLKIAALSLAVSGTLLAVFGTLFFYFAYQSGLSRMDLEIRAHAESTIHRNHPLGFWENYEESLQFIHGESSTHRIAVAVLDPSLAEPFLSTGAPDELLADLPPLPEQPPQSLPYNPMERRRKERRGVKDDSLLSERQFRELSREKFKLLDRNDDGTLSPKERRARHQGIGPKAGPGPRTPQYPATPPMPLQGTFKSLRSDSGNWRIGIFSNPKTSLVMALNMEVFYHDIHQFRTAFIIAVPIALIALGFAGWFLAARALRPVSIIAKTAAGITAKGFDQRIPAIETDSELQELVTVANGMLDRLEKSYRHAVRFSADAAHELQTPLTILQGELDNAIHTSENGSVEQQRYSDLLAELSNLKSVVQKLLLLSHADEGRLNINHQSIDLSELMHMAAEDLELMAPTLETHTEIPDGISIEADPIYLNQILRNLTSNIAKYSPDGGKAHSELRLDEKSQAVHITFTNTSQPIPAEDQLRIFDRFHRVDPSRTTAGSGLGLSLVREIARAHGGDIVLNPASDGCVSFTLTLPCRAPQTDAV